MVICLCSILALASSSSSSSQSPKEVEKWVENMLNKQEKITKLHFYFHRLGGKSGIVVTNTTVGPTSFGVTAIKDDPLTLGPSPSSTHIGYAQGMSADASLEDVVLYDCFAFSFVDAKHNGSTLAVAGSNPILHKYREMAIVGGTGVFRLARGIVAYRTYFYNISSGDSTVEVDLVVSHY